MLADEVKNTLDRRKWSYAQAEIATGVGRGTIYNMARGLRVRPEFIIKFVEAAAPQEDRESTLARYLTLAGYPQLAHRVSPNAPSLSDDAISLIGPDVNADILRSIPLVQGSATASMTHTGAGQDYAYDVRAGEAIPDNVRAIRVAGDSMEPAYKDGDILFVQESRTANDGDEVIALLGLDGITCKVYREGVPPYLEPYNGEGRIAAPSFMIAGIVVGFYRRNKRR